MVDRGIVTGTVVALALTALWAGSARAGGSGRYGEKYCSEPGYHCTTVGKGQSWESLWPDDRERDIVMKLNRMNIRLRPGMDIAVPDDMTGKTFMDYSPYPTRRALEEPRAGSREDEAIERAKLDPSQPDFADQEGEPEEARVGLTWDESEAPSSSEKVIIFDPQLLAWAAYGDDGYLVRWGPAVGGRGYCPDIGRSCRTRTGVTHIIVKKGPYARSNKYPVGCSGSGCAPVPFFMEFFPGYGFHASKEVPGYHASHGCVRMFYDDAKWLNEEFVDVGMRAIIRSY